MSATVIGDYTVGPATASSLLTGLVAFWKLEEASGTRVDEVGNNDLSDNNTVTQAAGKIGNAAQFTAVNNEWLSITDNTDLSTGDIDFTIACWVYLDSTTNASILGKFNWPSNQREYLLLHLGGVVEIRVSSTGSDETSRIATTFGALSTSTWYFVAAWHDSVNNTLNIQINNGTIDSSAYSIGVFNSSADFNIGMAPSAYGYFDGRIDAVGFWKRVLTADERTALYAGGSGIEYPF